LERVPVAALQIGLIAGALLLALPWPLAPEALWRLPLAAGAGTALLGLGLWVWRRITGFGLPGWRLMALTAAGLCCGLTWSCLQHVRALEARIEPGGSADARRLLIRIASDPVVRPGAFPGQRAVRFDAEVLEGLPGHSVTRLRLSWFEPPEVRRGETWRVAATVRAPRGFVNPGGFDQERRWMGQRIHGTGSVRRGERVTPAAPGSVSASLAAVRAALRTVALDAAPVAGPVVAALLTGDGSLLSEAQWAVFRATGTLHLMIISGLHIGLAVALGFAAGRWLWRLYPPLLLWLDVRKAGAWTGAGAGLAYTLLSGAGLPAVRACVMAVPLLLLAAWGRRVQTGASLRFALAAVLLLDPLAVHQQGFWLSFGAVTLLVVRFGRRYGREPAGVGLARAQWVLAVAMAPLLLGLTGTVPLVGPLANLVAVPLVSLLVVPLVLASGVLLGLAPAAAAACLWLADALLAPLLQLLERLAGLPQLAVDPGAFASLLAALAAALWLFGAGWRYQLPLWLALAVVLVPPPLGVAEGTFRLTVLDVGQGDAVLVDTARHRLLFDAGPAAPGGFEAGSTVVAPAVRATGPARLDALVLSHADLDHVGGAPGVLQHLSVGVIHASFDFPGSRDCEGQAPWRWDGVTFHLLTLPRSGPGGRPRDSNDGSCVLLVQAGGRRALLAGDIGVAVEMRLLRMLPGTLDVLLAPHHGSLTSSSRSFVRVTRPRWALFSAGLDNRYGHPHPRVVARYRDAGAGLLQTGGAGALRWNSAAPETAYGWRARRPPYWRGAVLPVAGN